ncbi:MAG TPA: SCO family protein [Candidatus Acidoferrales bacterium]|nr:SCO family protein [Candidatus Acidoferrales bacterium]
MKRNLFSSFYRLSFSILLLVGCFFFGCSRLPVIYDLSGMSCSFLNQDSVHVSFPSKYSGRIVVMSFIYTHCPDICPLTTNNMQHLQDTLSAAGLRNVRFVTLTFDPNRDTPQVLKEYAKIRGINPKDWDFLSGPKANTDSVLYSMDIRYFPGDSSYTGGVGLVYYITHTDKCVLIDQEGRVRGTYGGSQLDFGQIVKDIKSLE